VLLGHPPGALGGSEYLKMAHGLVRGRPAPVDLNRERALQMLLVEAATNQWIGSAHDCAEGGLAVAVAECCVEGSGVGARIDVPETMESDDGFGAVRAFFGEAPSRVVVSVMSGTRDSLLGRARDLSVPASVIGRTGGETISLALSGEPVAEIGLDDAEQAWGQGLTRPFGK